MPHPIPGTTGITLSAEQMYALLRSAGASPTVATNLTAIGLAESGGVTNTANDETNAAGVWQIYAGNPTLQTQTFQQQMSDPVANAQAAMGKYNSQGYCAWSSFNEGCPNPTQRNNTWRNFLGPANAANQTVEANPSLITDLPAALSGAPTPTTTTATTVTTPTPTPAETPTKSVLGLWQIGSDDWAQFGGHDQLITAEANAQAAFTLFQQHGFSYWKVFVDGSYANFLNSAQQICAGLTTPPAAGGDTTSPVTPSGFNANTPAIRQSQDWSCSATSMAWMETSAGHPTTEATAITQLGSEINSGQGLVHADGSGMASVLTGLGFSVTRVYPAAWSDVIAVAGTKPVAIGGVGWDHWTAVRGYQNGQLQLANPSPGWGSVGDVMSQTQFNSTTKGPFAMVEINV